MLFTVIGDPHAKPDNLDKINTLFDIIEDLGNPCILLGDLLDTKEVIRGKCLNTYYQRLSHSKLDFIILSGNHDYFNLLCEDHALETLKSLPNVIVVDTPMELHGMNFMPYTPLNKLPNFKEMTKAPLFCHMDMPGFDFGNGHISNIGLHHSQLRRFPIVISGHYHKYQEKENIVYLGTPFSHSFGESNQQKYIGLFDSETQKLELLDSPFPQHKTVEYDANGEVYWEDLIMLSQSQDKVRVVLTGSQDSIDRWDVQKYPSIKWILKPTQNEAQKAHIDETMSPEVQFQSWATDIAELDEDLVSLGMEVLRNV